MKVIQKYIQIKKFHVYPYMHDKLLLDLLPISEDNMTVETQHANQFVIHSLHNKQRAMYQTYGTYAVL